MNESIDSLAMHASAASPKDFPPAVTPLAVTVGDAVRIATMHFEAGRRAEAESVCMDILRVEPEQVDALHICGAIAHLAGKDAIALALLEKAARLRPAAAAIQYNLGVVQGALRLDAAAMHSYRAALAILPGYVGALHNLGNLYLAHEQLDEAEECYRRGLALVPHHAPLQMSTSLLFAQRRDLPTARSHMERALELDPHHPLIRWEAAQLFLLMDDYARGWPLYEARFPVGAECKVWRYPFSYPRWNGESLTGRHLLIHGEQGLGDEIMFLSIVPELLAEGARITLVGQPHLKTLWTTVFPQCRHFTQLRANEDAWTKVPPPWIDALEADAPDFQIPFASLPLLRRRAASDFERQAPFVRGRADKAIAYGRWLESMERQASVEPVLRIGIVWAGNPAPLNVVANRKDAKRSLPLNAFAPLFARPGIQWVSLQTWLAADQIKASSFSGSIIDAGEKLTDFSETAALIENLDLVISVDTSVAHLAGAMGKPVWILLPFAGEWRWATDPFKSLWWPTARLFRQPVAGDWASVIAAVDVALAAMQRP